jgi:hypothetical protein
VLNRGCARAFTDSRKQIFALQSVIPEHPDFDEFVGSERALDFGHHAVGQARAAEDHDRMEAMSARPEGATIGGADRFHRVHCKALDPVRSPGAIYIGLVDRHLEPGSFS